jgi:hypothetical protein
MAPATPVEIANQLAPAASQSAAALDALRQAGLDQATIDALADQLAQRLTEVDGAVAGQEVVDRLSDELGRDRLLALAQSFERDHPTPVGLFDLGEVSDDVASSSGYGCLIQG